LVLPSSSWDEALHMGQAWADRKDKSLLGMSYFTRWSKSNYSPEGWQHLVKGYKNWGCFALMVIALMLVQAVFRYHR
jgi:hypothetical protein